MRGSEGDPGTASESCFQEGPALTHQQPPGPAHRGQGSRNRTRWLPRTPGWGEAAPGSPTFPASRSLPSAPDALCPAGLPAPTTRRAWMLVCAHVRGSEEGAGVDWVLTLHGTRPPGGPSAALPRGSTGQEREPETPGGHTAGGGRGGGTGESLARAPGGSAPHADGAGEGAGAAEDTLRDGVGTALRRLCRGLSPECQATSQAACWAARAPSSGGSLGTNISDSLTLSPPNPTCPSSHSSSAPSPTELCLRVQRLRHPRAHGAVTAASVRAPFLPTLPAELQALREDDAAALPAPEPSCCLTRVRRGPALVGLNAPRGRGGSE